MRWVNIEIEIPAEAICWDSMCQRLLAERNGRPFIWSCVTCQPARSSEQLFYEAQAMRDIRGDLQDRASLLEEQISAHQEQFEKLVEQITAEHEARLEDLRAEFGAVTKLLELEQRRLGNTPQTPKSTPAQAAPPAVDQHRSEHQPATNQVTKGAHQPTQQPATQSQQSLADFLVSKLNELGALSREDLRRLSLQEGYFADAESGDRGVHATLLNVVNAGLVRQLPNGNFAPATVLDTIRLRRAI